jgi:hypothetical protein
VYRIEAEWQSPGGGPYFTRMHFERSAPSQSDAQLQHDAMVAFLTAVEVVIDSNCTWQTLPTVNDISPDDGSLIAVYAVTTSSGNGNVAGDSGPLASQALVQWFTEAISNNRVVRGRTFLPCIGEAQGTEGRFTGTPNGQVQTAADALIANSNLAVWSRPTPPAGTDGEVNLVVTANVWDEFAVLRSRRD